MRQRYRKFSYITDIRGITSFIRETWGIGFPRQPSLNKERFQDVDHQVYDENWFIKNISNQVVEHEANRMEYPFEGEKIFEEPLVGFVRGDDPIFQEFKSIIGPHHLTPEEAIRWQANKNGVTPPKARELSVVSFILPITRSTKDDNRKSGEWVAERWAQTRLLGELFSQQLVREVVSCVMNQGILAVSPDATSMFNKKRYPNVGWASPWSHRHIAYAAGLGTFGLHDFLITEKGSAHRCGSFVVNLQLQPNRERPKDIHAYCLHYQNIKCLKCKSRCPIDAITKSGHDKERCSQRVAKSIGFCNKNYHIFIYGCGLCSTGVPCESGIPEQLK